MHPHEIFYYTLYLPTLWITACTYLPMYMVRVCVRARATYVYGVSVSVCVRDRDGNFTIHMRCFLDGESVFGYVRRSNSYYVPVVHLNPSHRHTCMHITYIRIESDVLFTCRASEVFNLTPVRLPLYLMS